MFIKKVKGILSNKLKSETFVYNFIWALHKTVVHKYVARSV